ncbi:hypothetical protein BpHYR1_016649 [Brachionus plicatilis]|uniref:Uncharacterized protein n=1 Tax=Brachionus plicatilis TaxID=10195 RepID=A0A3M7RAW2_BRAPC|nr:hypothetical protein BpHYR1_016649 [Brachionus plicatilis]
MRNKTKIELSSFLVKKNYFSSFILSIASFELITCLFASCCSSISASLSCSTGLFVAIESTISASKSIPRIDSYSLKYPEDFKNLDKWISGNFTHFEFYRKTFNLKSQQFFSIFGVCFKKLLCIGTFKKIGNPEFQKKFVNFCFWFLTFKIKTSELSNTRNLNPCSIFIFLNLLLFTTILIIEVLFKNLNKLEEKKINNKTFEYYYTRLLKSFVIKRSMLNVNQSFMAWPVD